MDRDKSKVIRVYPPVMDCRILDLNAGLNPSLVVALFVKMCNRVSRARASSKCLTERVIGSNQMEKWIRPPRFPFFCYPRRHSSSGDGRLEPQKIHDKLPFHGSQKTYRQIRTCAKRHIAFEHTEIWKGMRKDVGTSE